MSTNNVFTIAKVSWLIKRQGETLTREDINKFFIALVNFLQKNHLAKFNFLNGSKKVDDDFEIKSSDLTEEGLEVLKYGFDKWCKALDRGKDPTDVKILEKTLEKVRNKKLE